MPMMTTQLRIGLKEWQQVRASRTLESWVLNYLLIDSDVPIVPGVGDLAPNGAGPRGRDAS